MRLEPYRSSFGGGDVSTTMIYTHVLNQGGRGVRSPADMLRVLEAGLPAALIREATMLVLGTATYL